MAAVIGTQAIVWAAGANPAAQNITIPVGTTGVYMFWTYYTGVNGQGIASVTLAGAAANQTFEINNSAAGATSPGCGVSVWYNPPSGVQSLDPAWDAIPSDGPVCIVVFVNASDTTSWRDVDGQAAGAGGAVSVTLTTVAGDLVLKWDSIFSGTPPSLSPGGWANAATQTNSGYGARASSIVATGVTQIADGEDESYSGLVAVSIPDAAPPSNPATQGQIKRPGPGISPDYMQVFRGRLFGHRPADTPGTQTLIVTPSGGMVLSGVADILRMETFLPVGGLLLGGAAPVASGRTVVPTGGIQLSGAAAVAYHVSTRIVVPTGGIVLSGAAGYIPIPVGGGNIVYQKLHMGIRIGI